MIQWRRHDRLNRTRTLEFRRKPAGANSAPGTARARHTALGNQTPQAVVLQHDGVVVELFDLGRRARVAHQNARQRAFELGRPGAQHCVVDRHCNVILFWAAESLAEIGEVFMMPIDELMTR